MKPDQRLRIHCRKCGRLHIYDRALECNACDGWQSNKTYGICTMRQISLQDYVAELLTPRGPTPEMPPAGLYTSDRVWDEMT